MRIVSRCRKDNVGQLFGEKSYFSCPFLKTRDCAVIDKFGWKDLICSLPLWEFMDPPLVARIECPFDDIWRYQQQNVDVVNLWVSDVRRHVPGTSVLLFENNVTRGRLGGDAPPLIDHFYYYFHLLMNMFAAYFNKSFKLHWTSRVSLWV